MGLYALRTGIDQRPVLDLHGVSGRQPGRACRAAAGARRLDFLSHRPAVQRRTAGISYGPTFTGGPCSFGFCRTRSCGTGKVGQNFAKPLPPADRGSCIVGLEHTIARCRDSHSNLARHNRRAMFCLCWISCQALSARALVVHGHRHGAHLAVGRLRRSPANAGLYLYHHELTGDAIDHDLATQLLSGRIQEQKAPQVKEDRPRKCHEAIEETITPDRSFNRAVPSLGRVRHIAVETALFINCERDCAVVGASSPLPVPRALMHASYWRRIRTKSATRNYDKKSKPSENVPCTHSVRIVPNSRVFPALD